MSLENNGQRGLSKTRLLDSVIESLPQDRVPRNENGRLSVSAQKYNYDELITQLEQKPFNDWLINEARVSDEAFLIASEFLQTEYGDKIPEPLVEYFESNVDGDEIYNYQQFVNSICREVRFDLRYNNGDKIRKIIENTQLAAIHNILQAPVLSMRLFEGGQNDPTVYDLEIVVAKATILHIAANHVNFLVTGDVFQSDN